MKDISILTYEKSNNKGKLNYLYLHINSEDVTEHSVDTELAGVLASHVSFDSILFVGQLKHLTQVMKFIKSGMLIYSRLEKKTSNLSETFRYISFNPKNGKTESLLLNNKVANDGADYIKSVRNDCLNYLFKKNNAIRTAPAGVHYESPSKHHTNIFIRTSCVLESPGSLSILKFWLTTLIAKYTFEEILVDTSSILSIATSISYERFINGQTTRPISVSSFKSYQGIDSLKINKPDSTLILISASLTGGLQEKLRKINANNDLIFTLFSLIEADNQLCKLNEDFNEEIRKVTTYPNSNSCEFCKAHSLLIPLHGEAFSIEPPKIDQIELIAQHLPSSSKKILNTYSATGFFKVYKRLNNKDLEIFLDVSSLFQPPENQPHRKAALNHFQSTWKKTLLRGVLGNLRRIIYTSSHYSDELAKRAKVILQKHVKGKIEVIRSQDLAQQARAPDTSSIVISACLDNAYELTGVNQDLRNLQPNGNVAYLFPITRSKSKIHRDRVKSTLTHGNSGPNAYDLHTVQVIDIPECNADNSWLRELSALKSLVQWADIDGITIPSEILERIEFLNTSPSVGLSEKLFWGNYKNLDLKIRHDYVFIDRAGELPLSQADIYVSIAMVLHNLREGIEGPAKLISRPYHIGVISPENFVRFNDGIIHASLLRASRGFELQYANCDPQVSERTKNILLMMVSNYSSNNSESLMEFLIALLIKSLTLLPADLKEVCNAVINTNLADRHKIICKYIQSHHKQ